MQQTTINLEGTLDILAPKDIRKIVRKELGRRTVFMVVGTPQRPYKQ